jgi:hypothetical protein
MPFVDLACKTKTCANRVQQIQQHNALYPQKAAVQYIDTSVPQIWWNDSIPLPLACGEMS